MALKNRGEVPFPQAGEGVFFRFTLADIAELESFYGSGVHIQTIQKNLSEGSAATALKCMAHGLKRRNAEGKYAKVAIEVDDIDFPLTEAFEPIMDGLCIATANMTFAEMMEQIAQRQREFEQEMEGQAEEPEEGPLQDSAA